MHVLACTALGFDAIAASGVSVQAKTDEYLLAAFKKGHEDAFDEIFRRHEGPLIGYLTKMTGDIELSRDICQDRQHRNCQRSDEKS